MIGRWWRGRRASVAETGEAQPQASHTARANQLAGREPCPCGRRVLYCDACRWHSPSGGSEGLTLLEPREYEWSIYDDSDDRGDDDDPWGDKDSTPPGEVEVTGDADF